ncbi:integrase [Halostagnicola larsenii XH-48]|uniref:Integrase n=1 Tax=Halostagnicola larsenii XH-48 TaxID=797299 RepID=W0JPH8_9EURY|nr:site-specific integrase [Halostagnicola larsenii]AHF99066.1 integrase [Halostagnicola larsenii XH-48]AHF99079.1 integrase [Halostagnicola larsenii XH-48]
MSNDLEPLSPQEAVDLYVAHRELEVSAKTLQNHEYRLNAFVEWCNEVGIDNLNDLSGRDLHRYRVWRQKDVNVVTLRGQLATLRVFLEFCASIDAVEPGMRERVKLPDVDRADEARDVMLDEDRSRMLLSYLERYSRASRSHVIVAILWHTGIRLGGLRAIDLDDYEPDEQCVWLRHRPESETPLKNQGPAERPLALDDYYTDVIDEYIRFHRHDVVDEYGREPLVTSDRGRLSSGQIRSEVYRLTQPCLYKDCPHDRDPDDCEARVYGHYSECPSSLSPHTIRRGSITYQLREDIPEEIVSDRCDVSSDILERHYDRRTDREKMEQRRDFITDL